MKKYGWIALVAFFIGILLANIMGKEGLYSCEIINGYYLSHFAYQVSNSRRLFCYVFLERGKMVFICFLLGRVMGRKMLFLACESLFGIITGFLVVAFFWNLGLAGIIVVICGGIPQWGCYLLALWEYVKRQRENTAFLQRIFCLVLIFVGILLETQLNPVVMRYIIGKIC